MRVFDDDQQILECLTKNDTFKGSIIDDKEHQAENTKISFRKELELWNRCLI